MYTQNKATTASATIFFQQSNLTVNKTPHTHIHEVIRVSSSVCHLSEASQ